MYFFIRAGSDEWNQEDPLITFWKWKISMKDCGGLFVLLVLPSVFTWSSKALCKREKLARGNLSFNFYWQRIHVFYCWEHSWSYQEFVIGIKKRNVWDRKMILWRFSDDHSPSKSLPLFVSSAFRHPVNYNRLFSHQYFYVCTGHESAVMMSSTQILVSSS